MQLEEAYAVEIKKLVEYVDRKQDPLKQIVRTHQHNSAVSKTARRLKSEVQKGTRQIQYRIAENTEERWRGKRMHGKLPSNLNEKLVDNEQSKESTILTAKDQAINTNYFKDKILKEEINSKCRFCTQREETIDHLISGCSILAKNKYLMRHDKDRAHLHYSICKVLGTETTDKWYTHTPKPVYE